MADIPILPDEQLCPRAEFKQVIANNFYLDFDRPVSGMSPIVVEVLRNHPLAYVISCHESVAEIYLQQAWRTMAIELNPEGQEVMVFRIYNRRFSISFAAFKEGFNFPLPGGRPGVTTYDPLPSQQDFVAGIRQLGYVDPEGAKVFVSAASFRKAGLQGDWEQFFSIIQRCLTQQWSGTDKATKDLLQMFYSFVSNRYVDYAAIIWNDWVQTIKTKKAAKKLIPYYRFLQVLIDGVLNLHPDIPRKDDAPKQEPARITFQKAASIVPGVIVSRIPMQLLMYADQTSQVVINYMAQAAQGQQPAEHVPVHAAPVQEPVPADAPIPQEPEPQAQVSPELQIPIPPIQVPVQQPVEQPASSAQPQVQMDPLLEELFAESQDIGSSTPIDVPRTQAGPSEGSRGEGDVFFTEPQSGTEEGHNGVEGDESDHDDRPPSPPPRVLRPRGIKMTPRFRYNPFMSPVLQRLEAVEKKLVVVENKVDDVKEELGELKDRFEGFEETMIRCFEILGDQLCDLQESCKPAAARKRKRHDDDDSDDDEDAPNPHEGEKSKKGKHDDQATQVTDTQTAEGTSGAQSVEGGEPSGSKPTEEVEEGEIIGEKQTFHEVTREELRGFDFSNIFDEEEEEDPEKKKERERQAEIDKLLQRDDISAQDKYMIKHHGWKIYFQDDIIESEFPLPEWCYAEYQKKIEANKADQIEKEQLKELIQRMEEKRIRDLKGFRVWKETVKAKVVNVHERQCWNLRIHRTVGRQTFNLPYLEDSMEYMFVEKLKEMPGKFLLMERESWNLAQRTNFIQHKRILSNKDKDLKRLKEISAVDMKWVEKVSKDVRKSSTEPPTFNSFAVFDVMLEDGSMINFSEADFYEGNIDLTVIEWLYYEMKGWTEKKADTQDAEKGIERYMRYMIVRMSLEDFMLGIEARQPFVNLTRRMKICKDMDKVVQPYTVMPLEKGVVYLDADDRLSFMSLKELHKFSDQTLKIVGGRIRAEYQLYDPNLIVTGEMSELDKRNVAKHTIMKINKTIRNREMIRIFERHLGLRKKDT